MNQHRFIFSLLSLLILILPALGQNLYNPNPTSYRNQTWMSNLDYGLLIRQMSIIGTHSSLGLLFCLSTGGFQNTQISSLQVQLQSGIRAIDIRVKHKNNKFQVFDRICDLGVNFDQVLTTVKTFLTSYPSETVLLHLVQQQSSSGTTRTFEDTFVSYRDAYPGLFWDITTQDPQLGQVRGQIVLIQDFNSLTIYGLLYASFSILPNYNMGTNWDLYDKWTKTKTFITNTNTAKKSAIGFWTGHGGSYPYFVASGKSSQSGGRLVTGLTTPGFSSRYPDFPRVSCFIGICSIVFEGINILGYKYIINQNYAYTGIIFVDLYGDDLLKMVLNKNTALYPKCPILKTSQGCTLCALGSGDCLKCNTKMNYVYDSVNKKCLAKVGYYLDITYIPQLCYSTIPGCLQCLDAITCTKCDVINHFVMNGVSTCIAAPGYYLDLINVPTACPQLGCSQCTDSTVCTVCSASINFIIDTLTGNTCKCDNLGYFTLYAPTSVCICIPTYYLATNSTCQLMPRCPDITGGCLSCVPITNICLSCDTVNHFVFDPTNQYCVCDNMYFFTGISCSLCNTVDAACDQCVSANLCMSCVANFTLVKGVCQCNYQYYMVDGDTCQLCSRGCLACTGIGACTTCDTSLSFVLIGGYCECSIGKFLQPSTDTCIPCGAMAGCLDCNTAGCILCQPLFGFHLNGLVCQCDYGYFVNSMKVCQKCIMDGCLNCMSQTQCLQCDSTQFYITPLGTCDDVCGDGFKIYVECDDGNVINGDGCSSQCTFQTDYTCTGGSRSTKDVCSYSGPFYMSVLQTLKDQKKNQVFLQIQITPNIQSLQGIDFSQAIVPIFNVSQKTATFDNAKGLIKLVFTYNSSLNSLSSTDLQVGFNPPTYQPQYFYMKSSSFNLPQVTNNNLALKYYDQSIYSLLDIMKTMSNIVSFLYIGICLICFIFVSKLIAIELILVPQVGFAGLIMIQKIQALLEPLNGLYLTNGYNPLFTDSIQLPPRIKILNYGGEFLTNFNICLAVALIPVLIGIMLLIVGKIRKSKRILKYSCISLKQYLLSVLLVFQFQFTVSLGIDFLYGQTMIGKAIGGLLLALLICLLILFYKRPLNFGQFKDYFTQTPLYLNHYIIVVLIRIMIAADLVILSTNVACGFVAIGLACAYTLYLIIVRPYLKNIRPILNMLVMIAILVVESMYKINYYSQEAQFITSYLPLFILVLLLVLLLVNVIFMILELRQRMMKKQINDYQKNEQESMDAQMKKQLQKQLEVIQQIQSALNPKNISKIGQKQKKLSIQKSQQIKGLIQLKEMHKSVFIQNGYNSATPLHGQGAILYDQI